MHKILAAGGYYPVSICCMTSLSYGRFPYACCAPSSAAPVPVQGRPPFDFLGNTDGSAPAVILNTKFLRHMFLFVLKWQ